MSLLVVGSVAYDTVETPFGKVDEALGGSAIYFSAAASFFVPVRLVAVVGEDFDRSQLRFLEKRNVDLTGLTTESGLTFRWAGRYDYDLNARETLYTHLNVFENFVPRLPESYRDSEYIFLANIMPQLQMRVLEQVDRPKLVVLDTMNYWIENTPAELQQTLKKVDVLIINDAEARQLSQEANLFRAARSLLDQGPHTVVIKKGEHGALMVTRQGCFWAPAYPLETLCDPTGAGDTFAGGFVGYLAYTGDLSEQNLRRAVVYGSVLASFCVERFSVDRLRDLKPEEIQERFNAFLDLTRVDHGSTLQCR
ncbi:MAG: PfkB family carbohydrate kinase [candidate division KSB1 bacterium]|nr:PfkB family carbohydrate kinase [candidate division KSB1 bacterium]MDZ7295020.1 PfkB family carbohydrate kinase [candidate division KSB1 bacterium]MDZ7385600.1 PfkB family carbohydrate kinase [candidate division KSB1 bacterium]MDZ7394187.1 PfkB family carbohydrate kinase [candidate division KSB1 bacterium]